MGGVFRARPSAELALACIGLGVLIGYGLAVLFGATRSRPPAPEQGGWVLAVSMTFKSAEDLAEFYGERGVEWYVQFPLVQSSCRAILLGPLSKW